MTDSGDSRSMETQHCWYYGVGHTDELYIINLLN